MLRRLSCLLLLVSSAHATEVREIDLGAVFGDLDGSFVLHAERADVRYVHDAERAATRFVPASTYKIPHTLIALETGVADGPEFAIPRDEARDPAADWWPRSWRGDQTLQSALTNSVVWAYREIARRIGPERMTAWLERLDYGNRSIGGGIDRFWLEGDLRISPLEQVGFLRRLRAGDLDASDASMRTVREMLRIDATLSGKTGTAMLTDTRELGWMVGWIEADDETFVYALNIEGERVWEDWPPQKRAELVRALFAATINPRPAADP